MKKRFEHYKNEDGVVAITVAVLMVILLSFSAMAIDLGMFYIKKSQLQTALDVAALAASYKLAPPADIAAARTTALAYIVMNGFNTTDVVITFENNDKTIKLTSARQEKTYFANVFGVNHLDYGCLAAATSTVKPIAGAAMGFAIYSGNTYPNQPSFSVRLQNVCVMSGLTNYVYGTVHANYNVDANTSTVIGVGEAVGTVTGINIQEKVSGAAYVTMPDFTIYRDQIKADAQAAGQYYPGNFSSSTAKTFNLTSPVYVVGNANLSNCSFSGAGCVYAGGKITGTGNNGSYASDSKISIFSYYKSASKSDAAIDFSGSDKTFTGMLYAPRGSILISGSNYTFSGCIIGAVVDVSGSNKQFYSQDISDSFKYATTSAFVLTQ